MAHIGVYCKFIILHEFKILQYRVLNCVNVKIVCAKLLLQLLLDHNYL